MPGVVKDAGKQLAQTASQAGTDIRRARILATATKLRAAQTDEEAADALEAALELAKD